MNTIYYSDFASPIGLLRLRSSARGLTGLFMDSHRHGPEAAEQRIWRRDDDLFAAARTQLAEYFAGGRVAFDLAIDREALGGTPFQRRVWRELETIRHGATISYGELAARIGQPGAVRAVGLANGRNPLSIIVPCHRVIGANGSLTGYGGGLERKRWLLEHERAATLR